MSSLNSASSGLRFAAHFARDNSSYREQNGRLPVGVPRDGRRSGPCRVACRPRDHRIRVLMRPTDADEAVRFDVRNRPGDGSLRWSQRQQLDYAARRAPSSARRPAPATFRSRALAKAAGTLLALAALGGGALPASAQTARVLVSNIAQDQDDSFQLGSASDAAQSFATGSNADGYTLSSIELRIYSETAATPPTVKVFSGSAASGTEVATLTGPASLPADAGSNYTFTVPANTTLAASTTYYVVAEGGSGDVFWRTTASNNEDATSTAGWSIGDGSLVRDADSTGSFATRTSSTFLRVNGIVKSDTTPPPEMEAAESFASPIAVHLNLAPKTISIKFSAAAETAFTTPSEDSSEATPTLPWKASHLKALWLVESANGHSDRSGLSVSDRAQQVSRTEGRSTWKSDGATNSVTAATRRTAACTDRPTVSGRR